MIAGEENFFFRSGGIYDLRAIFKTLDALILAGSVDRTMGRPEGARI